METMRQIFWMVGASGASCLAIGLLMPRQAGIAVAFGMFGPLAATSISWMLAERTFRKQPEALTQVMIGSFVAKMVFFGVYVTVMLRVLMLTPVPFVVSFTSYFIVLYLIEAFLLKRLFGRGMRASR
jgi:hypothetical protein